jgi:hypothetical protein
LWIGCPGLQRGQIDSLAVLQVPFSESHHQAFRNGLLFFQGDSLRRFSQCSGKCCKRAFRLLRLPVVQLGFLNQGIEKSY